MPKKNSNDGAHLRIVGKDKQDSESMDAMKAAGAIGAEEAPKHEPDRAFDDLMREFDEMYWDEWEGFVSESMGREEFVRTVVEIDSAGFAYPFIIFDTPPTPTAKPPMKIQEKYSILDMEKMSKEDEDLLYWSLTCDEKEFSIVFVPKEAVRKLEEAVHEYFRMIVAESEAPGAEEYDPAVMFAVKRELRITFNNLVAELTMPDDEFDDDEDFDDDFDPDDGFDDDFDSDDDEGLDGSFGSDDEVFSFNGEGSDSDDDALDFNDWDDDDPLAGFDFGEIEKAIDEEMQAKTLCTLGSERYKLMILIR